MTSRRRDNVTLRARNGRLAPACLVTAAFVVLMAGCRSSGSSTSEATAPAVAGGLHSRSTSIGNVLVDSTGHSVYELDGNTTAHLTCTGDCQNVWPPVVRDGTQLIVNGHPAYTYTGDGSAGQVTGHGVQDQWGHWRALDANGNPIRTGPPFRNPGGVYK